MSKYVYDNHEIHEGVFVILQTLDALEGKYCGSLPSDIEEEMAQFKRHLISYVEPKDKYEDVDFADTNPNLQDFNQALESIDPKLKDKLLGGIFAIFANNHELSLNPISDISKYKDENISI